MNHTEHGQNLIQLSRLTAFNCFLVREDDGFTLVDANLPGSKDAILQAASDYGGTIKRITLTHSHTDHIGSLEALKTELPEAEFSLSEREAAFIRGDMSLRAGEPDDKLRGGYVQVTTEPDRLLHDGDKVGSLRVVAAPGHTPGQIAFFDERDNTLIAGDAFQTRGGIAVAGQLVLLFPFPKFATWHEPTALGTAKKLTELNPSRLAVGHGKVIENPVPEMRRAIQTAERG